MLSRDLALDGLYPLRVLVFRHPVIIQPKFPYRHDFCGTKEKLAVAVGIKFLAGGVETRLFLIHVVLKKMDGMQAHGRIDALGIALGHLHGAATRLKLRPDIYHPSAAP